MGIGIFPRGARFAPNSSRTRLGSASRKAGHDHFAFRIIAEIDIEMRFRRTLPYGLRRKRSKSDRGFGEWTG